MVGLSVVQSPDEAQALRESERHFAAVFEQAAGGIAVVDTEGRFTLTNQRFCEIVGRSARELSRMRLHEITHDDDLSESERLLSGAIAGGGKYSIEKRYLRPDGSLVWVALDVAAIRDEQGRTTALLAVCQDISERKRTEAMLAAQQHQLRKSEQRYRSLFDSLDYGLCIAQPLRDDSGWPVDFRIVECNPAFAHYTGFSDAPGKRALELFPGLDAQVLDTCARVAMSGEPARLEHYAADWDRWFDLQAFRFGKPECGYLAVLFKDVTRRKRAEARDRYLVALADALRSLDDAAAILCRAACMLGEALGGCHVVCCEVDREGRCMSDAERSGTRAAERPAPLHVDELGAGAGAFLRSGVRFVHDGLSDEPAAGAARESGQRRAATGAQVAVPLRADGRLAGLLLVRRDRPHHWSPDELLLIDETAERAWIAARRAQAEAARRESEANFRALADNISQIAWIADASGAIAWFNRRWFDYVGREPGQPEDVRWKQYVHPDHARRVLTSLQRCWNSGQPWEDTFPLRGRHDEYRWFLSRAMPIRDTRGRIVRWFGTCTDVTDQRAAEQALEEAGRRKDEFLATLGHELRNPLAPIRHAMHVLRLAGTGSGADATATAVAMIDRQVRQMVRLVDDLLDVSRITMGKLHLRPERVDLAAAVRQAVEAARPYAGPHGRNIRVALPSGPVHVEFDPGRLGQVLDNLLSNACKYTEAGGNIELAVEPTHDDAGRPEARIRVRDDGIGVPAEHLPRLFEKFWQARTSVERSQGGLGIGLAMVRGLVELHGGTIVAHSDGPGRGTEFVVRLPVPGSPALPPADAGPETPAARAGRPKPRRILVVDDNRDSAESLAMLLRFGGDEVQTAFDGLEALAVAERFRPEIALLDIGMPKLNGYDTCRRLREHSWGRQLITIAQTGWGQDQDRIRARDAGFDAHLVKPVDFEALTAMLAELSGGTRPPRAGRPT